MMMMMMMMMMMVVVVVVVIHRVCWTGGRDRLCIHISKVPVQAMAKGDSRGIAPLIHNLCTG